MKITRYFLVSVVAAWLTWSSAYGEPATYQPTYPPPTPIPNGEGQTSGATPYFSSGGVFSDYINYKRDCCEGRPEKSTPLFTELYLRAGPSVPVGGQTQSRELQTGWSIMFGGRALFFNEALTNAWTVDLHIINTNQSGGRENTPFPITVFQGTSKTVFGGASGVPGVTVKAANRTLVGVGAGREHYLWQPAGSEGNTWRVGYDGGGRYGSQRIDLNETRHLTDTIAGVYVAVHTDVDIPTHYGLFYTGLRLEWAYTWSDVLQRPSDVQDISLLWSVGMRF